MSDYTKYLRKIGMNGFSCIQCGNDLAANDEAVVCSDCGAVFCKHCVENGDFANHKCEDE